MKAPTLLVLALLTATPTAHAISIGGEFAKIAGTTFIQNIYSDHQNVERARHDAAIVIERRALPAEDLAFVTEVMKNVYAITGENESSRAAIANLRLLAEMRKLTVGELTAAVTESLPERSIKGLGEAFEARPPEVQIMPYIVEPSIAPAQIEIARPIPERMFDACGAICI